MKIRSIRHLVAFLLLAAAACAAPASDETVRPDPAHNARNALDWAGTYRGVLPCADCSGIETVVTLVEDGTYGAQSTYLGKSDGPISQQGRFVWNGAGNTITLEGPEAAQYLVGENRLTRLAMDGSRITGDLAQHYVLTKAANGITEKYWKLVELNGRAVPALKREPYLILKAEGGRVTGYGGCNDLGGNYEADEATLRIRFEKLIATMRACDEGMDIEQAFHKVLRNVDNYSLAGDSLTLNKARMAPLARFEAVYLR